MKYQNKSFSVPAVGERKECESHWKDRRGFCVFCGEDLVALYAFNLVAFRNAYARYSETISRSGDGDD